MPELLFRPVCSSADPSFDVRRPVLATLEEGAPRSTCRGRRSRRPCRPLQRSGRGVASPRGDEPSHIILGRFLLGPALQTDAENPQRVRVVGKRSRLTSTGVSRSPKAPRGFAIRFSLDPFHRSLGPGFPLFVDRLFRHTDTFLVGPPCHA